MKSLVLSVLMFGAPIYSCFSDRSMCMLASDREFRKAEDLTRDFIRWALRAKCDTRVSMLYLLSNCESLQLLCHKACWRFFRGLETYQRAATDTVHLIRSNRTIPPEHWGSNTIRWWPGVAEQYPKVANTQPLYKAFRLAVVRDLGHSDRLQSTGLVPLARDMA